MRLCGASVELYKARMPDVEAGLCSCSLAAAVADKKLKQSPHGGHLVNLLLPEDQRQAAVDACTKTIQLSDRNACDVELLTIG